MKAISFKYLQSITGEKIDTLEAILQHERLCKDLWIEFIFNPQLVKKIGTNLENPEIRDELTKALNWYLAFRWLFAKNKPLEELQLNGVIKPYPIKGENYRKDHRSFLKGMTHLIA